jgi:hypothetical protein
MNTEPRLKHPVIFGRKNAETAIENYRTRPKSVETKDNAELDAEIAIILKSSRQWTIQIWMHNCVRV